MYVLFHIVGNTVDGVVLYFSHTLHNKMGVAASEIVKDDWNLTRELEI